MDQKSFHHVTKARRYEGESEETLKKLCMDNKLAELKQRVNQGADIRQRDEEGNLLTHTATIYDRLEILKWLILEQKISYTEVNNSGQNIFQIALEMKRLSFIKWFIEQKERINLKVTIDDLHLAIKTNDLTYVTSIVKLVPDVTQTNKDGKSIIELAHEAKQKQIKDFLAQKFLYYVLKKDSSEEDKLKKLKTNLNNQDAKVFGRSMGKRNPPIIIAAQKSDTNIVKWLVSKGADPNSKDTSGNSLLTKVTGNDSYSEIFKWLVNNGADIKSMDKEGNFAIENFLREENIKMLRWCIQEKKFNILEKNKNGTNIVMSTITNGKKKVLKFLIDETNLDINLKFDHNQSLLHLATTDGDLGIVKLLLESNAEIIEDQNNKTPIDLAIEKMSVDIANTLIFQYTSKIIEMPDDSQESKIEKLTTFFDKYDHKYIDIEKQFDDINKTSKSIIHIATEKQLTTVEEFLIFSYASKLLFSAETDIIEKLKSFFFKYKYTKQQEVKLSEITESVGKPKLINWLNRNSKRIAEIQGIQSRNTSNVKKEYNVLLLGETGVGKSTFINAFVNYINFNSLDEASRSENIYSLIPSSFIITDENYDRKLVTFGKDENESFTPGQSSTQTARSYSITTDTAVLRIIDTPGIGDTRGIEKDQENFDKLLRVIGELEHVHAICVMLKPNNSRLNVLFEYCIKGIFSHLDKSASQNIVFLFTNSRGTFYRPGDTLPPLQKILKELEKEPTNVKIPFGKDNVFCMDNEAFRFLLARKHVHFNDEEKQEFSASWEKSSEMCRALTRYLIKLKPHNIQNSVSINAARRLSVSLSKPLAEVAKHISENILHLQTKAKQIETNKNDLSKLKKDLQMEVPTIEIVRSEHGHPFVCCTHAECIERYQVYGKWTYFYKPCYNPCRANYVQTDIIGHHTLRHCPNMRVRCQTENCKHSFEYHVRLYYTTAIVMEKFKDLNFDTEIKKNSLEKEDIENIQRQLENVKEEFKREEKTILETMAKFSHFLKYNSVIIFNDICETYIEELIAKEMKLGSIANKTLLEGYQNMKQIYKTHLNDLEKKRMESGSAVVTPTDILKEESKLYKLEKFGQTIQKFSDTQLKLQKKDTLPDKEVSGNETFSKFIASIQ